MNDISHKRSTKMPLKSGVLISLPIGQILQLNVKESVFDIVEDELQRLSQPLRFMLSYFAKQCGKLNTSAKLVVRPEMFVAGSPLSWLKEKVGNIADHICMTDGSALSLLPTFRNHLFLYDQTSFHNLEALFYLAQRAPGLFEGFHSQINSAFHFDDRAKRDLVSRFEGFDGCLGDDLHLSGYFYFNPSSFEDSLNWMRSRPPPANDWPNKFDEITYVGISESGLENPMFLASVCDLLSDSYFHPTHCVLLGASPFLPEGEQAIRILFNALLRRGTIIPRLLSNNVLFAEGNFLSLPNGAGTKRLVLPDTYPFWMFSRKKCASLADITIFANSKNQVKTSLVKLVHSALGPKAKLRWS